MPRKAVKARVAWEDQFCTPTLGQLVGGLTREHAALVHHARRALLEASPGPETIAWQGIPWRWTILLWGTSEVRPWAYLIPRPLKPMIALPLDVEIMNMLPRRLSRYVRDGLVAAPRVSNTCWAQWDLRTPEQTEEVLAIARQRFAQSLAPVA